MPAFEGISKATLTHPLGGRRPLASSLETTAEHAKHIPLQILQPVHRFNSQNTSDPRTGSPGHLACCACNIASEAKKSKRFRESLFLGTFGVTHYGLFLSPFFVRPPLVFSENPCVEHRSPRLSEQLPSLDEKQDHSGWWGPPMVSTLLMQLARSG